MKENVCFLKGLKGVKFFFTDMFLLKIFPTKMKTFTTDYFIYKSSECE